ncbi:MAG: SDR family oxidoreductase [Stygiobacter sp.]|nr:MAG: SDR family oxidoreductase [Stygiobacter sp.]
MPDKKRTKILITGGAGFIGSNLVDHFLEKNFEVVCLDNLSTGYEHNISHNFPNPNFTFMKGDLRDLEICKDAVTGCDYVTHQAALGSVPRSIADPINTNSVNIDGFLNMLVVARDAHIKRFVYAASSSTYGDSKKLPKVEHEIGKPLSPYAITKYVNELYAEIFATTYGMQCIGLRYFNVFGKRQDPNGAYAAVIPLWVQKLINYESPVINGDGSYSRDFTYVENVIDANEKALFTSSEKIVEGQKEYYNLDVNTSEIGQTQNQYEGECFSEVFNIAYGENTSLLELFEILRNYLSKFDKKIGDIKASFGPIRNGDIPHSQASILKAKVLLGYSPKFNALSGFERTAEWYFGAQKNAVTSNK